MRILEAAQERLRGLSSITDEVSDRIHYRNRPQGEDVTKKCIILSNPIASRGLTMKQGDGWVSGSFEARCFAANYLEARDLEEKVFQAFHGFTGDVTLNDGTTVTISYLSVQPAGDVESAVREGEGLPVNYGRQLDIDFGEHESVPITN